MSKSKKNVKHNSSAKQKSNALGKGLGVFFPNKPSSTLFQAGPSPEVLESVRMVKLSELHPNKNQPRKFFDEQALEELSESIKSTGIIQPILVSKTDGDGYLIIAGERRWRAARMAELKEVPVIIRELTQKQIMEQALIENIQRQDLNAIEEANALNQLITEYDLTQADLAKVVGKSRSTLANFLRLLNLPEEIQTMVVQGELTAGHARALLSLDQVIDDHSEDDALVNAQLQLAYRFIQKAYSVRQAEEAVQHFSKKWKIDQEKRNIEDSLSEEEQRFNEQKRLETKRVEDELSSAFATRVQIQDKENRGKILLHYQTADERERILDLLRR